jgi:hypothetical protein
MSGLAASSTAELGRSGDWNQGTRSGVFLERVAGEPESVSSVPVPLPPGTERATLTVLDTGWPAGQMAAAGSWLWEAVAPAPAVVAVTTATVPGMRHLEGTIELLGGPARVVLAVVGPRRNRWPRAVVYSTGRLSRAAMAQRPVIQVPHDPAFATAGLDSSPLPRALIAAAGELLSNVLAGRATVANGTGHSGPDHADTGHAGTLAADTGHSGERAERQFR